MKRKFVLASSFSSAMKLVPMVDNGALWFYAGKNMSRYALFKRQFGTHFSHQSFNENPVFVSEHRKRFMVWTDTVHRLHGNYLEHWLSDRFSSNPYVSDLFFHCLCIAWFRHMLRTFPNNDIILIAESSAVLSAAHKITSSLRGAVTVRRIGTYRAKAYFIFQVLINLRQLGALPYLIVRFILARSIPARKKAVDLKKISVMLDTYLFTNSFDQAGHFNNRYFTELHDLLMDRNVPTAFLPILHRISINAFPTLIRNIRNSKHTFILMEDYLNITDYLTALKEALTYKVKEQYVPPFSDIDVQSLVDEEIALKLFSFYSMFSHVIQKLPKRLRECGFSPDVYIQWNENQTFHKAINHGFHQELPHVVIVGGKPFVPPLNHLNLFCTSAERSFGYAPDRIVTCGSTLKFEYAQYDPSGTYSVGASFRYGYLWQLHDQLLNPSPNLTVAVLLPYDLKISKVLLSLSLAALQRALEKGCQVIIKGHPANKQEEIASMVSAIGLRGEKVQISEDSLYSMLPKTSAVISSSSSASVEAMCLGIPVILIGLPIGLDLNMNDLLPSSLWKMAFSEEEVNRTLNNWALQHPLSLAERREIGKEILINIFEPVTDISMRAYLTTRTAAA